MLKNPTSAATRSGLPNEDFAFRELNARGDSEDEQHELIQQSEDERGHENG